MTTEVRRGQATAGATHPPIAEKVACVDFDGTIAPWGAMFGFPEPLPGAVEAIRRLKEAGYTVVIFTSRLSRMWHLSEGRDPAEAILAQIKYLSDYCAKYDIPADWATAEKIPAEAYFDDKALGVDGANRLLDRVEEFVGGDRVEPRHLAYMAGFFDGEGSVEVYAYERKADNNGGGAAGSLSISATQKVNAPLLGMQSMWGGSIRRNARGLFEWKVSGGKAAQALREMLPYLIVKRRQAELAIEFQSLLRSRGGVRLTEEEKSRRLELVSAIKAEKKVVQ